MNRDPIAENGGPNLYAFAYGSPTTYADNLGESVIIGFFGAGAAGPTTYTIGNAYVQKIMTAVSALNGGFKWTEKWDAIEALASKLDEDDNGMVTAEEIAAARPIKIFGYSWGSATAVRMTRDLNKKGVTVGTKTFCAKVTFDVLLSLDPVRRWFSGGEVVEDNVVFYGNLYERRRDTLLTKASAPSTTWTRTNWWRGHALNPANIAATYSALTTS